MPVTTIRYWCHDNLWRIQEACQIEDRDGVPQDAWRSLAENGQVLMFETEEQAREYRESMKENSDGEVDN